MTPAQVVCMRIIPISLQTANDFVRRHHRHNGPVAGHKFSIGLEEKGALVGVAIAGRPVSRLLDNGKNIEIRRVCVREGHPNACSKLYARMKRIAQLMGYERIIAYTLERESGVSLRAIGAKADSRLPPQAWGRPRRPRRTPAVSAEPKVRWELNTAGQRDSDAQLGRRCQ